MRTKRICQTVGLAAALALGGAVGPAFAEPGAPATDLASIVTAADIANPAFEDTAAQPADTGDVGTTQTAAGAIRWFSSRKGSTAYEGYCERAVRLAWARSTRHPSAIAHWKSNTDGKRYNKGRPPAGAFVFWNISKYGHVGIADGKGGFWATNVNNRIGHATSVNYFRNYLGWKYGNSK
ncbi:hypothetical protein NLX83_35750 [Allokutzneria sp. A3M-2-11 16]|uniref:hypothetical protein n=1 Tax=Allokutzneria sp. A3M-2-11 16 TaxID=2962043 RepID=UPI0020B72F5A|nr:hypothetical protein [Allokutzneria sp. A3M-2-11 16]MCP3804639.1 hypothetical protein [Allokutzneria sp. A3M-2-11 16]